MSRQSCRAGQRKRVAMESWDLAGVENFQHPVGLLVLQLQKVRAKFLGISWSNLVLECAAAPSSFKSHLSAALSCLLRAAKAHGVLRFRVRLALLDLGLLERAVGLLLRDAAFLCGGSGQRRAVRAVFLHSIGIC